MCLGLGGLGGNNGRQSWFQDDVLVSLSTPGPTHHMLLGVGGPLVVGVATYGPRTLLSCAILAVVISLCQALCIQLLLSLHWPQRWWLIQNCTRLWSIGSCKLASNPALRIAHIWLLRWHARIIPVIEVGFLMDLLTPTT